MASRKTRAQIAQQTVEILERGWYLVSMITAPAVNAGAVRANEPHNVTQIEAVMLGRIEEAALLGIRSRPLFAGPGCVGLRRLQERSLGRCQVVPPPSVRNGDVRFCLRRGGVCRV